MGNEPPTNPGSPGAGQGPDWNELKGKLSAARGADRVILIAGLVFFVDSFSPWIGFGPFSASGWGSGGVAVLSVLCGIAALALVVLKTAGVKVNLGEWQDSLVLLILSGGAVVFALLRWITMPRFFSARYGLFVAIVAGAVMAYSAWMKHQAKS